MPNTNHSIGSAFRPVIKLIIDASYRLKIDKPLKKLVSKSKSLQWLLRWSSFNYRLEMRSSAGQRQGLLDLINWWGDIKGLTVVEIGSYRGESARLFLDSGKVGKLFCIDPWCGCYDAYDFAAFTNMSQVEKDFDSLAGKDPRVTKVKGTIETLVEKHSELKPDIVYVDGCHTYDAVKNDLTIIRKAFNPRIAVCGHDFSEQFMGCRQAIVETCGNPDAVFSDTSWAKKVCKNG